MPMTTPRAPQWPLTPALRLTALALLFVAGALLTDGWLSFIMWFVAVVLVVFAGIQLAKNWGKRG
jgi:energy-coupling factor transporter transmembrane protein EcfT